MMKKLLCAIAVLSASMVSASAVTLNMGNQFGTSNIDEITEWTQEGFTLTVSGAGNTKGKVPCYKSKNKEVRLYALNTLTISAPESIKSITFVLSSQGVDEQAVVTADTGIVGEQTVGGSTISWTGDASSITFTVGETNSLHSEGIADGSGQFDFTEIIINENDEPELTDRTVLDMGEQFGSANIDRIEEWQQEGFSFIASIGENAKGKVPCYKSKNKEVRLYALNTLSIQASANTTIKSISFVLSAQGIDEQAEITATSGEIQPQSIGSNTITWVGKADNICFTVGETNSLHPEGIVDGSGQFDFTKIIIDTDTETGLSVTKIINLSGDEPIEYFTTSGVKVINPSSGIFIRKQGNRCDKIAIQ